MKTIIRYKANKERGSALVTVVIFAAIVSMCAAFAYRSTIFQNRMSYRSLDYLTALNLAEAGAELAMIELNNTGATAFAGWTGSGPRVLATSIRDNENTVVGDTVVQVTNAGGQARITATGYVPSRSNPKVMRTVVLSTLSNAVASPWGEFGLFSYGNLKFSGGMTIDSFDPSNPKISTNKAAVGALGDISFYGSQTIKGNVHAGGNLWFDNNSMKVLGSAYYGGSLRYPQWNDPQISGERKQTSIRTPNRLPFPVKPVYSGSNNNSNIKIRPLNGGGKTVDGWSSVQTLSLSNSKVTFTAPGVYRLSNVRQHSNSQAEIVGSGDVQIYVDGDFDLGGISQTEIKGTTSAGGPNVTIVANKFISSTYGPHNIQGSSQLNVFADTIKSGWGMTMNLAENAKAMFSSREIDFGGGATINVSNGTPGKSGNLTLYATESAKFGQGAKVAGVFYGPDAKTVYSGGFDWWGAVIGKDIDILGGPGVHIDETLFKPGAGTGSVVTAWNEVSPIKL